MWQWPAEGRNTSLDLSQHAGRAKDCWGEVSVSFIHTTVSVVGLFDIKLQGGGKSLGNDGNPQLARRTHDKSLWREWNCRYGGGGSPGLSGSFINWAFALKEGKNGCKKLRRAHLLIFLPGVTKLKLILFFFSSSCNIIPLQRWLSLRNSNRRASSLALDLGLVGFPPPLPEA